MSHQRAEMLADQVGQLTARIAELSAENTRLTARLAEETAKLAVCDVCCKQRARDCEEARNVAREMWGQAQVYAGGDEGCTIAYLNDQAEVYPWLLEKPTL